MVWPTWTAVAEEEARFGRGQLCTLPTHQDRQEQRTPTRSGQILGKARGTGCTGPTSMGLAWRPAGVGACHPTSLFGRLGLQSSGLPPSLLIHRASCITPSEYRPDLFPLLVPARRQLRHYTCLIYWTGRLAAYDEL